MNSPVPAEGVFSVLTRRPSMADGLDLVLALVAFGVAANVLGRDLLAFDLIPLATFLPMAVLALLTPAVAEEVVFRGLLIRNGSISSASLTLAASTALFVVWHVVESLTFLPGARLLFLRGDFLVLAAVLGLLCGLLRLRSGGLWTAIALHWLVVVIWKAMLGGPTLTNLVG